MQYSERLSLLDLESLQIRRTKCDLLTRCELFHNKIISSEYYKRKDKQTTKP